MCHIYILQSKSSGKYYYGFTSKSVEERLREHNIGKSPFTKKFGPWNVAWSAAFVSKEKARSFETYLKTPSGHAFSRKRLL